MRASGSTTIENMQHHCFKAMKKAKPAAARVELH